MFGDEAVGRASPGPGRGVTAQARKPQGDVLVGVQPLLGTPWPRVRAELGAVGLWARAF